MKKVVILLLCVIATSCAEDEIISDQYISEVRLDSDIEIKDIVAFNSHYILGGYGGFLITDQHFNIIDSYEENMILNKMINYAGNFACVCSDQGIFKIDQSHHIEKVLDLPCSDMEIDEDGRILFISGTGLLSPERQIPANILALDLNQQTYSYYSSPTDSIGVHLNQIEILENGEIFTLSIEGSIFKYKDKALVDKYAADNIDFFPEEIPGLTSEYIIKATGNQLYFTIPRHPRRLLKYKTTWEKAIDVGNDVSSEKERLFGGSTFFDVAAINGQCVIGTQNGLLLLKGKNEFDFIKYKYLSSQAIRKIYTNSEGKTIFILVGNIVATLA